MPDESEVIQADVQVEFRLPNGKVVYGKPVPYFEGRKILAQLYAGHFQPAIDRFVELSGISEEEVLELDPSFELYDLIQGIYGFFFRPSRGQKNGKPIAKAAVHRGA